MGFECHRFYGKTPSLQVHLPSRQSTTRRGLVLSGWREGDLLGRVAQRLLATSWRAVGSRAEGLVRRRGGGHFLVEHVAVAVSHHVRGGGVSVGHGGHGEGLLATWLLRAAAAATAPAAAITGHESGKLWLLLGVGGGLGRPSLGRRAHRHPAGVRVAVLVALPGALASHGYVRQGPGVWRKQRRAGGKVSITVIYFNKVRKFLISLQLALLLWHVSRHSY